MRSSSSVSLFSPYQAMVEIKSSRDYNLEGLEKIKNKLLHLQDHPTREFCLRLFPNSLIKISAVTAFGLLIYATKLCFEFDIERSAKLRHQYEDKLADQNQSCATLLNQGPSPCGTKSYHGLQFVSAPILFDQQNTNATNSFFSECTSILSDMCNGGGMTVLGIVLVLALVAASAVYVVKSMSDLSNEEKAFLKNNYIDSNSALTRLDETIRAIDIRMSALSSTLNDMPDGIVGIINGYLEDDYQDKHAKQFLKYTR